MYSRLETSVQIVNFEIAGNNDDVVLAFHEIYVTDKKFPKYSRSPINVCIRSLGGYGRNDDF